MSNRIFNKEQIKTLLQNPNVAGCSEKLISYRKDFKILAVEKYQKGLSPLEIFRQARFDIDMIGRRAPEKCLYRWRKVFRTRGVKGLKIDSRSQNKPSGRLQGLASLTDKEKLKRLEAEVAYLKKENRFLAKLRKKSLN